MALTTTAAILARLKQEVRDEVSSSDTEARLLARINEAYFEIVAGGGNLNDDMRGFQKGKPAIFSWALSETGIKFITEIPIEDKTVSATLDNTSVTLSSVNAASLVGWHIKINNEEEVYKITAHTAGTDAITLDTAYIQTTGSALSADIFKLDYELGTDLLLPTNGLICFYQHEPLPILDKREFEKNGILKSIGKGQPTSLCVLKRDTANRSGTIRFDRYPDARERFELPYVPVPAELDLVGSNPILEPNDNLILIDYAAALEYDLRDDTMSDKYFKKALDRFKAMQAKDKQFTAYQDPNFAKILGYSTPQTTLKGGFAKGGHPRNGRGWQGSS